MNQQEIQKAISKATGLVAPAWPLKNFVAVNPYQGLAHMEFNKAAQVLSERAGIHMGMDKYYYLDQLEKGEIAKSDVRLALDKNGLKDVKTEEFLREARFMSISTVVHDKFKSLTISDLAEKLSGKKWNAFMIDKISSWCAAYFDTTQTTWNTSKDKANLFEAWKLEAEIDRSPEIMGVKGFRSSLKTIPNHQQEAAFFILNSLGVPEDLMQAYLHGLMLKVVGWSSFIAGQDWDNKLYRGGSTLLQSFLSVLLSWEYCLYSALDSEGLSSEWKANMTQILEHQKDGEMDEYLKVRMILQDSFDFSAQRSLTEKFDKHTRREIVSERPIAQAVFCIDVRSEVFRRNLESVNSKIETFGFAGFFGFPVDFSPMGHEEGKKLCPALIPASAVVKEELATKEATLLATKKRTVKHQVEYLWKKFKTGAVASFGFVSPLGLGFLPKLLSDSYSMTRPVADPKVDGVKALKSNGRHLDLSEISKKDKVNMAIGALGAMNLGEQMAPLVLITGHGSTSVNNPHATGYDCGACGGNSGEINAMVAEKILNDSSIREEVRNAGIMIPADTHFVACLHDTTSDEVEIIGEANIPVTHKVYLEEVKDALTKASALARKERAPRFNIGEGDIHQKIVSRGKDWAQVRPEWGLAGCNAFVIAPRARTRGLDLKGRSFLQSYDWKADRGFQVLESIMTAPMVVTSWINLQYYASTTDNERFGSGNKTLHNITAGVGVIEGSGGDLRIGLPMQAIHDGTSFQHLPQRLNVIIEAPKEAIEKVLDKHDNVRNLLDNQWINLLLMNSDGKLSERYAGKKTWELLKEEQLIKTI